MMNKVDAEEGERLVAKYASAAALHGKATHDGNADVANRSYEEVASIYRSLRERGERERLLPLLADADPAVRSWAASHALEFAQERAVAVLIALASGPPSPERLSAQMTLRAWRNGKLTFP
jgi:hypothetical protein